MSSKEKAPKLWLILEETFIELTMTMSDWNTIQCIKGVYEKIDDGPKEIIDKTHQTRMLCNAIRHNGYEANDIDYSTAVEALAKCIKFFSDVKVPNEVSCILPQNKLPLVVGGVATGFGIRGIHGITNAFTECIPK